MNINEYLPFEHVFLSPFSWNPDSHLQLYVPGTFTQLCSQSWLLCRHSSMSGISETLYLYNYFKYESEIKIGFYRIVINQFLLFIYRGDRVLIFVFSNCYSGLLQPSDLSSLPAEHNRPYSDVAKYIFDIYIYYLCCLCIDFYDLSTWCGCWFVVYIRRFIYKFLNVLLISRLLQGVGRWARKSVKHTSWVAVFTPTDRHKSVRNRCFIELFCGVVCVVALPFWHFCWCRGFC